MEWTYKGQIFTSDDIGDHYGFIYMITNNVNNRKYIGKKVFWNKIRRPPLKGKKRVRICKKESDWKSYWGSSKYLYDDIEAFGRENFSREIISLHRTKSAINYAELRELVIRDVLVEKLDCGDWAYYNENIETKFYRSNIE